ncbi:hypothetical protein QQ045_007070 [Rhodiola kirilowii]
MDHDCFSDSGTISGLWLLVAVGQYEPGEARLERIGLRRGWNSSCSNALDAELFAILQALLSLSRLKVTEPVLFSDSLGAVHRGDSLQGMAGPGSEVPLWLRGVWGVPVVDY